MIQKLQWNVDKVIWTQWVDGIEWLSCHVWRHDIFKYYGIYGDARAPFSNMVNLYNNKEF